TTVVLRIYASFFAHKHGAAKAPPIFGAGVFSADFISAVLRYGSMDKYCLTGTLPMHQREALSALCPSAHDRLEFIDHENLDRLATVTDAVLAETGCLFLDSRILRRLFSPGRRWPVTGFIHSVQHHIIPMWFLQAILGDVAPWDALICSSNAGRTAINRYFEAVPQIYPELKSLWPITNLQLPVIPLATEPIDPNPPLRSTTRRQLGIADEQVMILYVGRFSPRWKCDLLPLLIAFDAMRPETKTVARLVLAGDDTTHHLTTALSAAAAGLGLGQSVTIIPDPTHAEKLGLYQAADIFVSPSDNLQETFGLVIIEAMAAGLPVLASDWNGYRELVVHSETGFLIPTYWTNLGSSYDLLSMCNVPEHDGTDCGATVVDVDHMKCYMEMLVNNKARRETMGRNARQFFMAYFQWRVVICRYEALWCELQACARHGLADMIDDRTRDLLALRGLFDHYPSFILADDAVVIPGAAASSLHTLLSHSERMPIPKYGSTELAVALLERAGATPLSIGELVRRVVSAGLGSELTVRLVLARLLKYAVLQPLARTEVFNRATNHRDGTQ
ncbi:MAG: hypothetical protein DME85_13640, partial [Verrucomicrobia bacterium]